MEAILELSKIRKYEISKNKEIIEYVVLGLLGFAIPLFLQGPQLLVGSVVNLALIVGAINVKGVKKLLPLIVLPSVSALASGILFGEFTPALLYLIPFIWLGNAVLVYHIKNRYVKNKNKYISSLGFAITIKVLVIATGALILTTMGLIPTKFLILMSFFQLVTALIGGTLAIPINLLYKQQKR